MRIYNNMRSKHSWSVTAAVVALPFFLSMAGGAMALDKETTEHYKLKLFGKYLFFDKSISEPTNQACASCHTPSAGWTNGSSGVNDGQVAVSGATPHNPGKENAGIVNAGSLKPPANAYASFIQDFDIIRRAGGNFWNGRATGEELRNLDGLLDDYPDYVQFLGGTADQAFASPFINPVEQGLPDMIAACEIVESTKYAPLYAMAYPGAEIECGEDEVAITFGRFAVALAAYQHSEEVNAFDSKHDRALADDEDKRFPLSGFTEQENRGHDLFFGPARCSGCHRSAPRGEFGDGTDPEERFTGDRFRSIGIPRNYEIPGSPEPDIGLAATTGCKGTDTATEDEALCDRGDGTFRDDRGLHKVPTLRNVDKRTDPDFVKAYGHNGFFKSLKSIVHFYNTARVKESCPPDVKTEEDALALDCWPVPEINNGISRFVGDLGLSDEDEDAIVAYMKTLSDIPTPKQPMPFSLRAYDNGQLE